MSEEVQSSGLPMEEVEKELSHYTDHLMGGILTLIDAVVVSDRQCEKTKDTIRQFFANYRGSSYKIFSPFRNVGQTKAK